MSGRRETPEELLKTGLALHQQGKVAGASRCYEKILRIDRKNFAGNYFLGLTCGQTGQYRKAAELLGRAIAINPEMPEAHYNRGTALLELKEYADAEECFAAAVELKPDYAVAWFNRGDSLRSLERYEEALAAYDMAVALRPDHVDAHYLRGLVLDKLNRFEAALTSYDQAIALDPDYIEAWANRGTALLFLNRHEESLASFEEAVRLDPADARSWSNRGNALLALARFDDALASYDKAIEVEDGDFPEGIFNRSIARLLLGDLDQGFNDYEWRRHKQSPIGNRNFGKPLWLGAQELSGKTILIHDEQGLGDTIQFCRYLPLLEKRGARVLFAPKPSLTALMSSMRSAAEMVHDQDKCPPFDVQCPLMSLPHAFATELPSIPNEVPYLFAEPERVARWANRIGRGKLTIGVCWQGSVRRFDRGRSFSVTEFKAISKLPGVHLISLHKGVGESQLEDLPADMAIEVLGEDFDASEQAFLDTAAIMASCDLIISSDTAVAHLAGALGRPTWVALRHVPDWRWLLDRADSPWYPTMRLFRQSREGEWDSVFQEMEAELNQMLALVS
jgi:tetratricopeptide (TPR) repeat protein